MERGERNPETARDRSDLVLRALSIPVSCFPRPVSFQLNSGNSPLSLAANILLRARWLLFLTILTFPIVGHGCHGNDEDHEPGFIPAQHRSTPEPPRFGFLISTPTKPKIKRSDSELFTNLGTLTKPSLEYRE